jgi:uncharacterized cupredoxin-like copper-binding protein
MIIPIAALLAACGPNSAPEADAGPDQTVGVGDMVTLDGSGSTDPEGDPLSWSWAFNSRPSSSAVALSDPSAVEPTFTVDIPGSYEIRLVVDDGELESDPDTVVVSTENSAPVADAGPDQTKQVGETVTLDGSGSSDVDGDALTYAWAFDTRPAGSTAAPSDPTEVGPTFVVDESGTYVVSLVVHDGTTDSAPDTVTISTENTAPVADAGPDQAVAVNALVTLDGSESSDVDDDTLTYAWSLTAVPVTSAAVLSDTAAEKPTFTADLPGTYLAQLIVNDGTVDSVADTVTLRTAALDLEKLTNGFQADAIDDGDVPEITPGEAVTWTYTVANAGHASFALAELTVGDNDPSVTLSRDTGTDVGADGVLSPGETWTWTAAAVAADIIYDAITSTVQGCGEVGKGYTNIGEVTAGLIGDEDASHYCNPAVEDVDIETLTGGVNADDPFGTDVPEIAIGSPVNWTYLVTNTGNVPFDLADITVTDDQAGVVPARDTGSDTGSDGVLSPGETWTYTAASTAVDILTTAATTTSGCVDTEWAYENTGSVIADTASDADLSHYCNTPTWAVTLEKHTNGADADDPDGGDVPQIAPGDPVTWTYAVTNTGNAFFLDSEVDVTDDQTGVVPLFDASSDDPADGILSAGETWTWTAAGTAVDLETASGVTTVTGCGGSTAYENTGTVTADVQVADDVSHYCNPPLEEVVGLYGGAGVTWNDYVRNDGTAFHDATDTACDGTETGFYTACLHVGELLMMPVTGYDDCADLTASDALGAFEWTCIDDGATVRMVSTGLKRDKGLADLIDFATPAWLVNTLTVYDTGVEATRSTTAAWHDNTITVLSGTPLTGVGTIYVVPTDDTITTRIDVDHVGLVVAPGAAMEGMIHTANSPDFLWIEGTIDGGTGSYSIHWIGVRQSVLRQIPTQDSGIRLENASGNRITDLTLALGDNGLYGDLDSDYNLVEGVSSFGATTAVRLQGGNNVVADVTGVSGNIAVYFFGDGTPAPSNVLLGATGADLTGNAFWFNNAPDTTAMGLAAVNTHTGIDVRGAATQAQVHHFASTHAVNGARHYQGGAATWTGWFMVGNNDDDCRDTATVVTCQSEDFPISGTLAASISLATAFAGETSDSVNTSDDADGEATYSLTMDLLSFENPYRAWGLDGTYLDSTVRGACDGLTDECQIRDWRADAADGILRNRLPVPTSTDAVTFTHTWTVSGETECDAIPGATWDSSDCTSDLLQHAREFTGDAVGNDNLLCEAGERCLYTPNIGAYQGEGALQSAGFGGVGNTVELLKYAVNGG